MEAFESYLEKGYKNIYIQCSQTHRLSVFINARDKTGKKIFSLSRNGENLKIQIVQRGNLAVIENKVNLINYLKSLHFEIIRDGDWGFEGRSNNLNLEDAKNIFEKEYYLIFP